MKIDLHVNIEMDELQLGELGVRGGEEGESTHFSQCVTDGVAKAKAVLISCAFLSGGRNKSSSINSAFFKKQFYGN